MSLETPPSATLLECALPHGRVVKGIGIDLCEVARIAEAVRRRPERFIARIYLPGEIRRRPGSPVYAEHLAGLFAAKEAAMKALGTGTKGVSFSEIAVARERGGPPLLALYGRALGLAAGLGARAAHVTITHTRELAAAVVLLLGD